MFEPGRSGLVLVATLTSACAATDTFHCDRSAQCRLGDRVGFCEANTTCSFADGNCESGRRFDELGLPDVAGSCVEGGTAALEASGDGQIDQGAPTMVFGTTPTTKVDGNATRVKRAFVRFDLASLPAGASVVTATLRLCVTGASGGAEGRSEDIQAVTSAWDEATLTWGSRPTLADVVTTSFVVPATAQCLDLDVSGDARVQHTSASSFGWTVHDHDETVAAGSSFDVGMRENGDPDKRPGLVVSYSLL